MLCGMTPLHGPQIRTAGEHLMTPVGRCTARVNIHREICPLKFVLLKDGSREVILTMNFLREYGAVIHLGANRLTLRKSNPTSEDRDATSAAVRVLCRPREPAAAGKCLLWVGIATVMCGEAFLEKIFNWSSEEESALPIPLRCSGAQGREHHGSCNEHPKGIKSPDKGHSRGLRQ